MYLPDLLGIPGAKMSEFSYSGGKQKALLPQWKCVSNLLTACQLSLPCTICKVTITKGIPAKDLGPVSRQKKSNNICKESQSQPQKKQKTKKHSRIKRKFYKLKIEERVH